MAKKGNVELAKRRRKAALAGISGMTAGAVAAHQLSKHGPTVVDIGGKRRLVKAIPAFNKGRTVFAPYIGAGLGLVAASKYGATKRERSKMSATGASLAGLGGGMLAGASLHNRLAEKAKTLSQAKRVGRGALPVLAGGAIGALVGQALGSKKK